MMTPGKGILAADESNASMNKHLKNVGVEETEEMRKVYRDLLMTTPDFEKYISGVILYDETIRQNSISGVPFWQLLERKGVLPGIKVDKGLRPLQNFPGEQITEGLDGLSERLNEYYAMGARFAKWRAVIPVKKGLPTDEGLHALSHALTRYAMLCQEAHIVPMVEPEVLLDDPTFPEDDDHTIAECREVIERTMYALFSELKKYRVDLTGLILKTSMALPGKNIPRDGETNTLAIARETAQALKATVPPEVAGVVFLSGGQTPQESTEHLDAIAKLGPFPWPLTFSYSRAVEIPVLEAWRGDAKNVGAAQAAFQKRLSLNSLAQGGKYHRDMEGQ